MRVAVDAPNEGRGQPPRPDVTDVGRHVADADAEAPIAPAVGRGAVQQVRVVERELAGAHRERDRARLVDLTTRWPFERRLAASRAVVCDS